MASKDPRISEVDDPVPPGVSKASLFEDAVQILFENSKKVIADLILIGKVKNVDICRILGYICSNPTLTYSDYSNLRTACHSMLTSALAVAGPDVLDINLQPDAEQSDMEKAFLAVVRLMRRGEVYRDVGMAPDIDFERDLVNGIFELYLLLKAAIVKAAGYEVAIAEREVEEVIVYINDNRPEDKFFDRSFTALNILIGFIATEMERASPISTRDADSQAVINGIHPSKPFYFDLYLYMGYRYLMISEEDYQRLRSRTVSNHFTSQIGKAVILLGHAYRPKITENLIGVMIYFKLNLKTCTSLYYITRLVRDSISAYPSSFYRYMVLLCLISEITLAIYHEKKNTDPVRDYLNEACRYYKESGMLLYEAMLKDNDKFKGLTNHAKLLHKAWKMVSPEAINAVVLISRTTRDLMERYGDGLASYQLPRSLEEVSRSQEDEVSERDELEGLLYDDHDFLIPEYKKVSDYLDSRSKSPLPEAEPADVEGESNPEGQKGASSAQGRKGSADVEGKSNPEGQKDPSPTKSRKRPFSEGSPGVFYHTTKLSLNFPVQGLRMVHVNPPMVPPGQWGESSTQSQLHPSGEVKRSPGKSSPKSAEGESNTDTTEDVTPRQEASQPRQEASQPRQEASQPRQEASQPRPKSKKSKKKSKGKR